MEPLFKTAPLEMAYDTETFEEAAYELSRRYRVLVLSEEGVNGWPDVQLVGTVGDIAACIHERWNSGDSTSDACTLAHVIAHGSFLKTE